MVPARVQMEVCKFAFGSLLINKRRLGWLFHPKQAHTTNERNLIMPILNYDKIMTDMPALNKDQQCDKCGIVQNGRKFFYSYSLSATQVLCLECKLEHLKDPRKARES